MWANLQTILGSAFKQPYLKANEAEVNTAQSAGLQEGKNVFIIEVIEVWDNFFGATVPRTSSGQ